MIDAPELKPCPFCGGDAVYTYHNGGWPNSCDSVQCADWKCPSRSGGRPSKNTAAELWNTRADLLPTLSAAMGLPEVRAMVEAVELLGLRRLVAGWNGEGLEIPYTPHEPRLGVRLSVTAGTVYAIDAALAAIKEPKP